MTKPTDEQWRLLVALFQRKAPVGPSFAEIQEEWGRGRGSVINRMHWLRRHRYITWMPGRARSYEILRPLKREFYQAVFSATGDMVLVPLEA